jgi:hypothetical protein
VSAVEHKTDGVATGSIILFRVARPERDGGGVRRLIDGLLALRNDFGEVDRSQGIEGHFPSSFIGKHLTVDHEISVIAYRTGMIAHGIGLIAHRLA